MSYNNILLAALALTLCAGASAGLGADACAQHRGLPDRLPLMPAGLDEDACAQHRGLQDRLTLMPAGLDEDACAQHRGLPDRLPLMPAGLGEDACAQTVSAKSYGTVRTFKCPEASQGVAVDDEYFYGIGNQVIVKCEKASGRKVAEWREDNPELIMHFDGGIVVDGLLYCSHSNYPEVPMASSIEVFDTETLEHVRTISLGIESGSCTWIVPGENCWYLGFAHYGNGSNGAEPLKDNSWTQFVQYDRDWHRVQGWILPKELLEQLSPNSVSGCIFHNGRFYCTGHDATKLFVLDFPPYGMRLVHSGTIDIPFHGQGIAFDGDGNLWGIDRRSHSVIKAAPVEE